MEKEGERGSGAVISKDSLISAVLEQFPQTRGIFASHGLHCAGCVASPFETVEDGCRAHAMTPQEIDALVDELEDAAKGGNAIAEIPGYASSAPVFLTGPAASRLKKMMESEGKTGFGIRIYTSRLHSGKESFEMDFEDGPKESDESCESCGLRIFWERAVSGAVRGIRIDFKESVSGSGFTTRRMGT